MWILHQAYLLIFLNVENALSSKMVCEIDVKLKCIPLIL